MNHADLCSLGVKWLRRPASQVGPGCNIAASECTGSYNGEITDAIGFRSVGGELYSVVVEAKATRSDFLADAKKPHRSGAVVGMGMFRYYLAPAGLIQITELPTGWGLIEVSPRGALQLRCGHVLEKPQKELGWRRDYSKWKHTHNADRETALLVRLLARVGDVEALQLSLKVARNQVAKAQKIIAQQQVELRSSLVRYYELRQEYEKVTGNGLSHPVKRNIDPAKVAASIKEISPALVTPVCRPAADKGREP
ncbi:adenylosuccinate synthase [Janthinobacterium sp. NKUCC06_STL]|uniref:adenylosuccinate synthase n=1 Tax=Janthinobacterium sp. NKUCC06_STL TaxID=2842127 RepID=UPI001C5AF41D|nr:adenylosuccinate synthase [Janthinobacterium sp. NKUCC06_STL]MBW3512045.1 adenylosuccinate synthase [Janthinobacterium sp. NKUCC06_STL]